MTNHDLTLSAAVSARSPCELRTLDGVWCAGRLEALEPAGLLVSVPGSSAKLGDDVRLWFDSPAGPSSWSGSVVREQVPVPGGTALMIGLLSRSEDVSARTTAGSAIDWLRVDGTEVPLLEVPGRVLELGRDRLVFEVPRAASPSLVLGQTLRIRLAPEGERPCEVRARVEGLERDGEAMRVVVDLVLVERADLFVRALAALLRLLPELEDTSSP